MEPLQKLPENNDVALAGLSFDDNGWLDVASTIVPVNGRHFLILLYSILICIVP